MSAAEIDAYLAGLDPVKRRTLETLRGSILAVIPDAEQGMAYGVPAFRIGEKTVCGFAAFTAHLSFLPHSGSVLSRLGDDLAGYSMSKGALRFPVDRPLPDPLVRRMIEVRLADLGIAG